MNKLKELQSIISDIRYELPQYGGVHTMGTCSVCREYPTRGAGECIQCKEKRLAELVGKDLAKEFVLDHAN